MPRGRPRRVAVAPGTPAILESGLLTPLAVPVPVVAPLAVPPLASKETACAEAAWTQGNYGDVSEWTSRPTEATNVAPGPGIQIPRPFVSKYGGANISTSKCSLTRLESRNPA